MSFLDNNFTIRFLVLIVGQLCTLKCRDCSNFSPYADRDHLVYRIEDLIRDIKTLLAHVRGIDILQIQGGEPFIYPHIEKLLTFVISEEKIHSILLATNGTVIPDNSIAELLKNEKIHIRISDYSASVGKEQRLSKAMDEEGARYQIYHFSEGTNEWRALGKNVERDMDDQHLENKFSHCSFHGCMTLEDGKLARCSRAVHASLIQKFTPLPDDFFDVRDSFSTDDLIQWISSARAMEACRYCYGTREGKPIAPAIQLEKDKRNE